jgi:hypothetical protein
MNPLINLAGKRFGRLTVQSRTVRRPGVYWLCTCDCRRRTVVQGDKLRRGGTRSCGCRQRGKGRAALQQQATLYGEAAE